MQIALISPYHGGSHRAWASGYQAASAHHVDILGLPARFWKWRMHGGAVTLARRFMNRAVSADLLLCTDMLDVTTFLALTRFRTAQTPLVLYMHENQLTYPLPQDGTTGPMRRQLGERDHHYAFVNYASMLAADRVLFNSRFHLESLFDALPRFLKHFPEYNELNSIPLLRRKSEVFPVGIDLRRLDRARDACKRKPGAPALILWNQRWEYDKDPDAFFEALAWLAGSGLAFRVALCGQQFGKRPAAFERGLRTLGDRVVHAGHAPADLYARLLWEADITVSTAQHEFFGISVLEALYAHTFPLLPARLSYPELIPAPFHTHCLYRDQNDLQQRLRWAVENVAAAREVASHLAAAAAAYDWSRIGIALDSLLLGCANLDG